MVIKLTVIRFLFGLLLIICLYVYLCTHLLLNHDVSCWRWGLRFAFIVFSLLSDLRLNLLLLQLILLLRRWQLLYTLLWPFIFRSSPSDLLLRVESLLMSNALVLLWFNTQLFTFARTQVKHLKFCLVFVRVFLDGSLDIAGQLEIDRVFQLNNSTQSCCLFWALLNVTGGQVYFATTSYFAWRPSVSCLTAQNISSSCLLFCIYVGIVESVEH